MSDIPTGHGYGGSRSERTGRDYTQIAWLATTFSLCVFTNLPSKSAAMMQLVVFTQAFLHNLGEVTGEQGTSRIAIAAAIATSLYDVYTRGNTALFVSYLVATFLGVLAFSLPASCKGDESQSDQNIMISKSFTMINLLLKSLLENYTEPENNDTNISAIHDIQSALIMASFSFSIMALWLLASGASIFNPVRRDTYKHAREEPYQLVASILCWTGVSLLVAVFIVNITISPPEVHSGNMSRACYMRICGRGLDSGRQ